MKFHYWLISLALLAAMGQVLPGARMYTCEPELKVHSAAAFSAAVIGRLAHHCWAEVRGSEKEWTRIAMVNGLEGWVPSRSLTDCWIKIHKDERQLRLMKDRDVVQSYPIALGFNPRDDKVRVKDGCTPEGRFYLCQMIREPVQRNRYGARCMLISYPNREDARRGLKDRIISRQEYLAIVRAIDKGAPPPQNTALGSSIRIHGGGSGPDWTLGCAALEDRDIVQLYDQLPLQGAMVEIYRSWNRDREINDPGWLNRRILAGARLLLQNPSRYTRAAAAIVPLAYPMGDIDSREAVCTDIVIRALRHAGIDLQALVHEEALLHPALFPGITGLNASIDHRRTRNLKNLFDHCAAILTRLSPGQAPDGWKAGDIALFDTGIANGTIYDHIGIVSDRKMDGIPLVINIWVTGETTSEMDLLNGKYPTIVGHYRLTHPFDYVL